MSLQQMKAGYAYVFTKHSADDYCPDIGTDEVLAVQVLSVNLQLEVMKDLLASTGRWHWVM